MSTEKTEKLALHRWVAEDLFLRTEFNENFTAIDRQLATVDDRLAAHAGQHGAGGADPITPAMIGAASNPNLLDNWYFPALINQRGQTEYTDGNTYTIDRWKDLGAPGTKTMTILPKADCIRMEGTGQFAQLSQTLENKAGFAGQRVTLSLLCRGNATNKRFILYDGVTYIGKDFIPASETEWELVSATVTLPETFANANGLTVRMYPSQIPEPDGDWMEVKAVKLELGDVQTLAHQDENGSWALNDPPPDKGLELLKCITSTADAGDAYANKTVATAPVTGTYTGTGAARSIAVGGSGKVCLVWNGTHYAFVNENGFVYIWSSEGLSSGSGGVTEAAKSVTFANGVLTFAASAVYSTGYTIMNRAGTTYNYQVL